MKMFTYAIHSCMSNNNVRAVVLTLQLTLASLCVFPHPLFPLLVLYSLFSLYGQSRRPLTSGVWVPELDVSMLVALLT